MTSPILEALKIARETRDTLLRGSIQTSSSLRACRTICSLLKRERQNEWIDLELNGYSGKFSTEREMEKDLPEYRKTRCLYLDERGYPIVVSDQLSFIQDLPIGAPIAELETGVDKGLFLLGDPRINLLRQRFGVPALQIQISSVNLITILNAVNTRVLDFLNSIILELDYANLQSEIFEETRMIVDTRLTAIAPAALERLVATYRKVPATTTPLQYGETAYACRIILQDFTDAIFKPEYLRENEEKPHREQTKKKVYCTLRARLQGQKDTESDLLLAQMDYLNAYFDKLTLYIQRQIHPEGFEPTREDANRCIMYTYLIIGDILRFLD